MRHWVCGYCGRELMFEAPDRLRTQSTYHLIDEHSDRVVETYLRYAEERDCQGADCDGTLSERASGSETPTLVCDGCGLDHTLWWAEMQAYRS